MRYLSLRSIVLSSLVTLALSLGAGCGADAQVENSEPYEQGYVGPITIWNRSQFELLEVEVSDPETDEFAPVISAPLGQEESVEVWMFEEGASVAFVRERAEGGKMLRVETGQGVDVDASGYTLIIFDDTFRLLPPDHEDNPFGDLSPDDFTEPAQDTGDEMMSEQ